MSSSPSTPTPGLVGYKKRRLQGSCDICKRKKIRCDSAKMPDRCSNCIAFDLPCTHTSAKRVSGQDPPKPNLEGSSSTLLNQIFAQFRTTRTLMLNLLSTSNPQIPKQESIAKQQLLDLAVYARHLEHELQTHLSPASQSGANSTTGRSPGSYNSDGGRSPSPFPPPPPPIVSTNITHSPKADLYIPSTERSPPSSPTDNDASDQGPIPSASLSAEDKEINTELSGSFDRMTFTGEFAQSSELMLVKAAMNRADKQVAGGGPETLAKRGVFWRVQPWHDMTPPPPPMYVFPPDDLLWPLIALFFDNINFVFPILHRPTFERQVMEGLHTNHTWFGACLLVVCATASRYSEDPRIFLDGVDPELREFSAGHKYFSQVDFSLIVKRSYEEPVTVYELQTCCLGTLYLQGTSLAPMCFSILGLGMRLAQSVGAHVAKGRLTVERELWRRSFWCLIYIDTLITATFGRPRATSPDDYSLDMVAEVDDEYWEHPDPDQCFKQPPGKPSTVSQFVQFLKLFDILGFAQRTIYSVRKSRHRKNEPWARHCLNQLNSALDKWKSNLPEHLQWDPNRQDDVFFNQSALLHASFAAVTIEIHIPWITNVFPISTLAVSSLARCTQVARYCAHVMDTQSKRGFIPLPITQVALMISALILVINIWDGQRSGVGGDAQSDLADIMKCTDVLATFERRFQVAGRLNDIIGELLRQDEQTRVYMPSSAQKRSREEDPDSHWDSPARNVVSQEDGLSAGVGNAPDYYDIFSMPFFGGAQVQNLDPSNFASTMQSSFMGHAAPSSFPQGAHLEPSSAESYPDYGNLYQTVFGDVPQMTGEPFSFDFTWPPPPNF